MKKLIVIILLIFINSCDPSATGTFIYNKINGIKEPTQDGIDRFQCRRDCDREYHIQWCESRNWFDKLVFCKDDIGKRCLKECYIPYCKCNEKPEDWNYGMCKGYCEGKKNEINDKKNG